MQREQVKNIFDLWRENGCQLPLRVTRGWSHRYYVTVVRVEPQGEYGEAYGYGNIEHPFDSVAGRYWGTPGHIVKIANAGCGGWSLWRGS